jgi:hypothetical protein
MAGRRPARRRALRDGGTVSTLGDLDPRSLRDLASAVEARDPAVIARRELSPESVEALADMIAAGHRPTIGWWRRHRSPGQS